MKLETVRSIRNTLKLTQEQLADLLSVDRRTVANWDVEDGAMKLENYRALQGLVELKNGIDSGNLWVLETERAAEFFTDVKAIAKRMYDGKNLECHQKQNGDYLIVQIPHQGKLIHCVSQATEQEAWEFWVKNSSTDKQHPYQLKAYQFHNHRDEDYEEEAEFLFADTKEEAIKEWLRGYRDQQERDAVEKQIFACLPSTPVEDEFLVITESINGHKIAAERFSNIDFDILIEVVLEDSLAVDETLVEEFIRQQFDRADGRPFTIECQFDSIVVNDIDGLDHDDKTQELIVQYPQWIQFQ